MFATISVSFPATAPSFSSSHAPKITSKAVFTASWFLIIQSSASVSPTRMSPMALVTGSSLFCSSWPTSFRIPMHSVTISPSRRKKFSRLVRILVSAASRSSSFSAVRNSATPSIAPCTSTSSGMMIVPSPAAILSFSASQLCSIVAICTARSFMLSSSWSFMP